MNFDRHNTYAALSTGEKDGVSVHGLSGGTGEVKLASASYTAFDDSGFHNGGRYQWGWMTSPRYETVTQFDTLTPSWEATTPAGT